MSDSNYVGFWARLGACIIDVVIYLALAIPALWLIYGRDYFLGEQAELIAGAAGLADILINWVLPAVLTIAFWMVKRGTPGKLLISAHVVDAKSGGAMTLKQSVIRYFAYLVSTIPLCLGFLWIAFDKKKQSWHDKIAGTVVIKEPIG